MACASPGFREGVSSPARRGWSGKRRACRRPSSQRTVLIERGEPQHWLFGGGKIERLLEDLDLHGLLAQHALQITHAFLEFAHTACANDIVIGLNGGRTAFEHTALPRKELAGCDTGPACHI